jgi:hypothetical protein
VDPRIEKARHTAFVLYEGKRTPHRSCGIALAETFGLPTRPYQIFRRGGLTGEGECGAIKSGEVILGELLGDPDPAGAVTQRLRDAVSYYRSRVAEVLPRPEANRTALYPICNDLTGPRRFAQFASSERAAMCTSLAAEVAALVAETLVRSGAGFTVTDAP